MRNIWRISSALLTLAAGAALLFIPTLIIRALGFSRTWFYHDVTGPDPLIGTIEATLALTGQLLLVWGLVKLAVAGIIRLTRAKPAPVDLGHQEERIWPPAPNLPPSKSWPE